MTLSHVMDSITNFARAICKFALQNYAKKTSSSVKNLRTYDPVKSTGKFAYEHKKFSRFRVQISVYCSSPTEETCCFPYVRRGEVCGENDLFDTWRRVECSSKTLPEQLLVKKLETVENLTTVEELPTQSSWSPWSNWSK